MVTHEERREQDPYLAIFEDAPVAIWEEDFSAIKVHLDELVTSGVSSLRSHLTEHLDDVIACTQKVRVLHVNRLAREFYGASTKEELIQMLPQLFDDRSLAIFRDEIIALAEGNTFFEAEVAARTLTGEGRLVQMNVSLLPTPQSPWSRVIVAFTDLTERRRLEQEVLQSQKLESLGRLAGGVVHDLNNALTVIAGYSELLLSETAQGGIGYTGLDEIRKAGERAATLTQQLLAFSRTQVLQPRLLNLNDVIRDASPVLKTAIGEHIQLMISLQPDLGWTKVDPAQFSHVLLNLVLNARDAMPEGGTVEIRTTNVQLDHSSSKALGLKPGKYVMLSVSDTGTGMDEDTRRRAFDPFFTTKSAGKGTGLGLSSAFGIIKQSGGSISSASQPGSGSVFTIYLPADDAVEDIPAILADAEEKDLRGLETILVVEDETEVRGLLTETLRRFGYNVLECPDPLDALSLFAQRHHTIDLVITDVVMPAMTGPQMVNRMRQIVAELNVLFISGYANAPEMRLGNLNSRTAFLQKPFGTHALANMVRKILRSASVSAINE